MIRNVIFTLRRRYEISEFLTVICVHVILRLSLRAGQDRKRGSNAGPDTTYTRWQPWLGQVSIRSNLQDLWQEVDNTKT